MSSYIKTYDIRVISAKSNKNIWYAKRIDTVYKGCTFFKLPPYHPMKGKVAYKLPNQSIWVHSEDCVIIGVHKIDK